MGEAEHVVLSVAQALEQVAARVLLAARAPGDLTQDDAPVAEGVQQRRGDVSGSTGRP